MWLGEINGGVSALLLWSCCFLYCCTGDKPSDVMDSCEGGKPSHYVCASNGEVAIWTPCQLYCKPDQHDKFSRSCYRLCGDFVQKFGTRLLNAAASVEQEEQIEPKATSKPTCSTDSSTETLSPKLYVLLGFLGGVSICSTIAAVAVCVWVLCLKKRGWKRPKYRPTPGTTALKGDAGEGLISSSSENRPLSYQASVPSPNFEARGEDNGTIFKSVDLVTDDFPLPLPPCDQTQLKQLQLNDNLVAEMSPTRNLQTPTVNSAGQEI